MGISFGASTAFVLPSLIQNREIPVVFGIRAGGGGFIEAMGIDAMIFAQSVHVVVSVVDIVAGALLWRNKREGGVLGIALVPPDMILAVGLLLAGRLVLVPLVALALVRGWKTLT